MRTISLKAAILIAIAFSSSGQIFQSNVLTGNISSFNIQARTNIVMQMQITSPLNRTIGTDFISNDPIESCADTNGNFSFTNVQYGRYILRSKDSTGTYWFPEVGTNSTGTLPLASLCKPSGAIPPNPATNYYTMAQIDAKLQGASSNTNVFWNSTNSFSGAQPAKEMWVYPTPPYNQTNHPYLIVSTNYP